MSEKKTPSPQEERRASEKKLRKREKKLIDRLFEAHEDEADAWLRLKKAEARLEKRKARVQRIKNRLEDVREELAALRNPSEQQATDETELTPPLSLNLSDDLPSRSDTSSKHSFALDDDDDEEEEDEDDGESEEDDEKEEFEEYVDIRIIQDADEANTPPVDAEKIAHEARAAAEAAEQAARLAAERAREIANRLDQVGLSRHLIQELSELEAEAERAQHIAQEAGLVAQVAEQLVMKATLTEPEEASEAPASEQEEVSESGETAETTQESTDFDTVAAMIIADAAAIAAAEAEAIAEVSSARVREARNLVSQADEVLEQVRSGIDTGTLVGEDAEILLQAAERDASRARMALSEAEMAETKARKAAFAAEAEAEIAALAAFTTEQESIDQTVQAQESADALATTEATETSAQPDEQAEEAEPQETQGDTNADQSERESVTSPNDEQVSTGIVEQSEPIISDPADTPVNQMTTEPEEANNENVEISEEVKDPPPEIVTPSEATVEQQSGSMDEAAQSEEVIVEIVEGEEQGQFVLKETQNNGNEIYLVQEEQTPEGEVPQGSPFRPSTDPEKKTGDPATAQKSTLVAIRAFQTAYPPSGLNGKHGASHGHVEDDREATIKMPAIRLERSQESEKHSE